jgi:hypothetical protein
MYPYLFTLYTLYTDPSFSLQKINRNGVILLKNIVQYCRASNFGFTDSDSVLFISQVFRIAVKIHNSISNVDWYRSFPAPVPYQKLRNAP